MKRYEEFLYHILDEAEYLLKHSENIDLEEFLENETLKRAFVRSLEIIGEALKNCQMILKANILLLNGGK